MCVVFVVDVVVYLHYRDPVKVNACVIGILHTFDHRSLHTYNFFLDHDA